MEIKNQFKPFDKVLVQNHYDKRWKCDFYSHKTGETGIQTICGVYTTKNVIPYEGNEHLVGTTDEPDEEIKLEEGEWVMCGNNMNWNIAKNPEYWTIHKFAGINNNDFLTHSLIFKFAIRFSDFNPYDMEETKKHILCVKNGKIIKYKE